MLYVFVVVALCGLGLKVPAVEGQGQDVSGWPWMQAVDCQSLGNSSLSAGCPCGTNPRHCAAGLVCTSPGADAAQHCLPCHLGQFCPAGSRLEDGSAGSQSNLTCPENSYCPSTADRQPCPSDSICAAGQSAPRLRPLAGSLATEQRAVGSPKTQQSPAHVEARFTVSIPSILILSGALLLLILGAGLLWLSSPRRRARCTSPTHASSALGETWDSLQARLLLLLPFPVPMPSGGPAASPPLGSRIQSQRPAVGTLHLHRLGFRVTHRLGRVPGANPAVPSRTLCGACCACCRGGGAEEAQLWAPYPNEGASAASDCLVLGGGGGSPFPVGEGGLSRPSQVADEAWLSSFPVSAPVRPVTAAALSSSPSLPCLRAARHESWALRPLSCSLQGSRLWGVLGGPATGKSLLLARLAGERPAPCLRPAGSLSADGRAVAESGAEWRRAVGYIGPHSSSPSGVWLGGQADPSLTSQLTLFEHTLLLVKLHGRGGTAGRKEAVRTAMEALSLAGLGRSAALSAPLAYLTPAWRARAALALELARAPSLLLVDEQRDWSTAAGTCRGDASDAPAVSLSSTLRSVAAQTGTLVVAARGSFPFVGQEGFWGGLDDVLLLDGGGGLAFAGPAALAAGYFSSLGAERLAGESSLACCLRTAFEGQVWAREGEGKRAGASCKDASSSDIGQATCDSVDVKDGGSSEAPPPSQSPFSLDSEPSGMEAGEQEEADGGGVSALARLWASHGRGWVHTQTVLSAHAAPGEGVDGSLRRYCSSARDRSKARGSSGAGGEEWGRGIPAEHPSGISIFPLGEESQPLYPLLSASSAASPPPARRPTPPFDSAAHALLQALLRQVARGGVLDARGTLCLLRALGIAAGPQEAELALAGLALPHTGLVPLSRFLQRVRVGRPGAPGIQGVESFWEYPPGRGEVLSVDAPLRAVYRRHAQALEQRRLQQLELSTRQGEGEREKVGEEASARSPPTASEGREGCEGRSPRQTQASPEASENRPENFLLRVNPVAPWAQSGGAPRALANSQFFRPPPQKAAEEASVSDLAPRPSTAPPGQTSIQAESSGALSERFAVFEPARRTNASPDPSPTHARRIAPRFALDAAPGASPASTLLWPSAKAPSASTHPFALPLAIPAWSHFPSRTATSLHVPQARPRRSWRRRARSALRGASLRAWGGRGCLRSPLQASLLLACALRASLAPRHLPRRLLEALWLAGAGAVAGAWLGPDWAAQAAPERALQRAAALTASALVGAHAAASWRPFFAPASFPGAGAVPRWAARGACQGAAACARVGLLGLGVWATCRDHLACGPMLAEGALLAWVGAGVMDAGLALSNSLHGVVYGVLVALGCLFNGAVPLQEQLPVVLRGLILVSPVRWAMKLHVGWMIERDPAQAWSFGPGASLLQFCDLHPDVMRGYDSQNWYLYTYAVADGCRTAAMQATLVLAFVGAGLHLANLLVMLMFVRETIVFAA